MTPEAERRLDEVLERLGALPEDEQGIIAQLVQLYERAHGHEAEEAAEGAMEARLAADAIERAQTLQDAGEPVDESMTLREALAILERHGEEPAVRPESLDRAVEVPARPRPDLGGRWNEEGFWEWEPVRREDLEQEWDAMLNAARNAHHFGEPLRAGELRELANELDGRRQEVARHLGTGHPLFQLIDGALHSGELEDLRVAYAASDGFLFGSDPF